MSDREKLTGLLNGFGVEFNLANPLAGMSPDWRGKNPSVKQAVICEVGKAKVDGYCMFETHFYFDSDGAFVKMGIWE